MATFSFKSQELDDVAFLLDGQQKVQGDSVLMASGQTSSITPTHRHPPGTVLGEGAASLYYLATDESNVNAPTAASITSSGHTDGNGVISITGNHGTISVTTTTGSGTEANNATDLNADATFENHYVASDSGGELIITSLNTGVEEWFQVDTATMDTAGFAEGAANGVVGTDPDYRVTTDFAELVDIDAVAQNDFVGTLLSGHFDESALSSLTEEAKAVFRRRGSIFG